MDFFEAAETRRSVKHYDASFVMPEQDINTLLETTLLSPTSFNIQNWRFVLVEDKAKREAIKAASWGQSQVTDASLLFLLCADLHSPMNNPARYWKNAPQPVQDVLVPMIAPFYEKNPQLQRDEAMRSVGIASQTLMLAAKALGYDSCPMIGFDPKTVAEIIHLPENHVIGLMLVIGKAAKPAHPRGGQLPLSDVLVKNQF
ncbi:MAG: nitroreductase family protein [Cyanobacteria bacterium P01_H01_bin.74]